MATQAQTEKAPYVPTAEEVIEFCRHNDFDAEKVGGWVWVSFDETPDEDLRQALKNYGFRWSPRRKKWAHNCGTPTKSARQSNPWEKYDHFPVSGRQWKGATA
jgi:hypothetical protein